MKERHAVMIPAELISKIKEIEAVRPDIKGYNISKQVFVLLQEAIKANLIKSQQTPSNQNPRGLDNALVV